MTPRELVISEVGGNRSITLRGRTLGRADSGVTEFTSRVDPGLTSFDGQWDARYMAGDNAPELVGFAAPVVSPAELVGAFELLLRRRRRQLKVSFGEWTRYGTLHLFESAPFHQSRVAWRMTFLWAQPTAAPQAMTVIHTINLRGTDPDRALVGLSNPIGERFEPGTPEAEAHSERVRPPTPWEQIRDYARNLGFQAHVEGTPPTADADELRIVLRRPAAYYAETEPNEIADAMLLSRYGRLPMSEVRSWPAGEVSTLASWLGEVLRWELSERTAQQPRLDPKYLGETSQRYQQKLDACDSGDSKPGLSIVDREKFEADLAALNQYLVDVHACTNPDGSPKVDAAAQLGRVPDESGPAAALRLLKIARFRGAFLSASRRICGRV